MSETEQYQMSHEFFLGRVLQGNYRVEKLVGKGGMAWVFKTEHVKFMEPMAVKILLPHISDEPEVRDRFLGEARIQFKLKHPNIVQVTDIIEEGAMIAIIMEWVDGDNLKQLLKKLNRPISRKDMWRIMGPILDAVGYAHRQGLVHRDIKPANILLHTAGDKLTPKIADFGIAKIIDESLEGHTATGITMGTLKFMPPEQIKDSKRVDHRADIYALGATLYVMGTRRLPFLGKGDWVMYQQLNEDPAPPSSFNPNLSDAFDQVVLTCMAKDPKDRYQSCAELAQALSLALLDPQNIRFDQQEPSPIDLFNLLASLPEEDSVYSSSMEIMSPAAITPMSDMSAISFKDDTGNSYLSDDAGDSSGAHTNQADAVTTFDQAPTPVKRPPPQAKSAQASQQKQAPKAKGTESAPPSPSVENIALPTGANANALVFKIAGLTMLMMIVMLVAGGLLVRFFLLPPTGPSPSRQNAAQVGQRDKPKRPKPLLCQTGNTRPCYTGPDGTQGKGPCKSGTQTCKEGKWLACANQILPAKEERCNDKDDNCDGKIDESFPNKGKACQSSLGTCQTTGTYTCHKNQKGLVCRSSGAFTGAGKRVRLKIIPKGVRFMIRANRKRLRASTSTCLSVKGKLRLSIQHRRYYRCLLSVSSRRKELTIRMQKKSPMSLDPPIGYCRR